MHTVLTQLSEKLAEVVDRVSSATVLVDARPRIASSGVVWAPGVIVTCDHTIQHDEIRVRFADGSDAKATLAGRDRATDIAVLRVETETAPPAFASPGGLKAGNVVLAVGRSGQGVTAHMGIISTIGGPWRTWRGGLIDHFVRLDIALFAGSSGGATVDADGGVFGIATSGLSRMSAIAIPKTTVDAVVDELLRRGRIARGYLGVGLQPVAVGKHLKDRLHLDRQEAVIVLSVEPGGPAESGGVMIGDVLLRINGHSLSDTDEVQAALGPDAVGKTVSIELLRAGELKTIDVTTGERPRKE